MRGARVEREADVEQLRRAKSSDEIEDDGFVTAASAAPANTRARSSVGEYFNLPKHPWLRRYMLAELGFLFAVQRFRRRVPLSLRWVLERLISSHPMYDLSFAVWLATFVAMYYVGYKLMWIMSANIFVSFGLAWFVGGRAPSQIDGRLRPRGRVSVNGWPCIELQLASVLMAVMAIEYPNPAVITLASLTLLLLISLRIYGLTHFPHQLLTSLGIGGLSVPLMLRWGTRTFPRGLHSQTHLLGAIAVGAIFIGYIAYKAETNDAPVFRIPKEEYMRVLGDIMRGDDQTISQERRQQIKAALQAGPGGRGSASGTSIRPGPEAAVAEGMRYRAAAAGFGSIADGMPMARPSFPPAGPVGSGGFAAAGGRFPPAGPGMLGGAGTGMGFGAGGGGGGGYYPPAGPASSSMSMASDPDILMRGTGVGGVPTEGGDGDDSGDNDDEDDGRPKRDSFYYLMKSMERKQGGRQQQFSDEGWQ